MNITTHVDYVVVETGYTERLNLKPNDEDAPDTPIDKIGFEKLTVIPLFTVGDDDKFRPFIETSTINYDGILNAIDDHLSNSRGIIVFQIGDVVNIPLIPYLLKQVGYCNLQDVLKVTPFEIEVYDRTGDSSEIKRFVWVTMDSESG